MNVEKCKIRFKSHHLVVFFLVALATAALYLTGENGAILEEQKSQKQIERKDSVLSCSLFSGRWVFDNLSYPLYNEGACSFLINNDFACEKHGRKDLKYQNWKWQPHDCDLPRFNGTAFLQKIRGKKVLFVGDSLNRNQFVSLLCLIESSLHQSSPKVATKEGNMFFFQATEYNATMGFYWSPFLVESNCDDPYTHHVKDRMVKITAIEKHAKHWTDADILIFNSFMWWLEPTMTISGGSFQTDEAVDEGTDTKLRGYEMALKTWSDWLEININRTKTKMFFMSLSPFHFRGEKWDDQLHCNNESKPILRDKYWGIATDRDMMHVAESAIKRLEKRGLRVEYLNITQLSDYRKDAHPSIYRRFSLPPNQEQLAANPKSFSDCVHWCLPGVPDFWNQILYSYIINSL